MVKRMFSFAIAVGSALGATQGLAQEATPIVKNQFVVNFAREATTRIVLIPSAASVTPVGLATVVPGFLPLASVAAPVVAGTIGVAGVAAAAAAGSGSSTPSTTGN